MVVAILQRRESMYRNTVSFEYARMEEELTRLCSLAMSTMTTLVAALYSRYETSINSSFEGKSPAIISLFETFWDERFDEFQVGFF